MSSLLYTDRYCLAMSQQFWRDPDMNDRVSFELFVRSMPPDRGYMIAAGLGTALWWLEKLTFDKDDYDYLRDEGFDPGFCNWLYQKANNGARFFTGDVWAIPEGTPIAAQTPILRVTAPRIEATIVESMLLSVINQQTMVASKAARIVRAAQKDDEPTVYGKPVWDFSLRRLHGPEAGIGVARATYIAGCAGTATVEAGRKLGVPTTGTMAHHFVMARGPEHEQRAFYDFLQEYPDNHALLVDTYDTVRGVKRAIMASRQAAIPLKAIRLDSGNLMQLSRDARRILDEEAFYETKIMASSDLDEYEIRRFESVNAPIDLYGVGTRIGTVPDAPNIGGVYKLVEQHEWNPRYAMKLAPGKQTDPGCHQVWRTADSQIRLSLMDEDKDDMWFQYDSRNSGLWYDPIMEPVMERGRIIKDSHVRRPLDQVRLECAQMRSGLPSDVAAIIRPWPLKLTRSDRLWELRHELGDQEALELRDKERNA